MKKLILVAVTVLAMQGCAIKGGCKIETDKDVFGKVRNENVYNLVMIDF